MPELDGHYAVAAKLFGEKLRKLRESKQFGLKQASKDTGISFASLSVYERGTRFPPIDTLMLLSEGLGVPFERLLTLLRESYEDTQGLIAQ